MLKRAYGKAILIIFVEMFFGKAFTNALVDEQHSSKNE
jgi:hypothetical protein